MDDIHSDKFSVRPWNARTVLLIPAVLLFLLVLVPPHGLDLAVSSLFYDRAADAWPWHRVPFMSAVMHKGMKAVPIVIALAMLGVLGWDACKRRKGAPLLADPTRVRMTYAFLAMLAATFLVVWLKSTTGVACPWNVEAFGGDQTVRDPTFSFFDQPGRCWPVGHPTAGFCMFAF